MPIPPCFAPRPRILIADVYEMFREQMPIMSGYEVLEWMKRHPIDCGLVVATDAHPCASA